MTPIPPVPLPLCFAQLGHTCLLFGSSIYTNHAVCVNKIIDSVILVIWANGKPEDAMNAEKRPA